MTMANARAVYSGKYLRVTDLGSKRVATVIQQVSVEEFRRDDGKTEKKLVLMLRGLKPLVLNKTNAEILMDIFQTDESDEWVGKPVTLIAVKVRFQGKSVPCIRIEEPGTDEEQPLLPFDTVT
jgi:hypothetical protein